jgi:hypothetical protein
MSAPPRPPNPAARPPAEGPLRLPIGGETNLREVSARELGAGKLLVTPLYLLLQANRKYLRIRRPFEAVDERLLSKLQAGRATLLYPAEAAGLWERFRQGTRARRRLDQLASQVSQQRAKKLHAALPLSDVELSALLPELASEFWGEATQITHLEAVAWVEGFCSVLPAAGRDALRAGPEDPTAVLAAAAWTVILALELGYFDGDALDSLRSSALMEGKFTPAAIPLRPPGAEDLANTARGFLEAGDECLTLSRFSHAFGFRTPGRLRQLALSDAGVSA